MKNRLNERPPGANFTVQQLKDREQRLKKELNVVEKSGFGWDPQNKLPTAIDEKWAELSSEQRKWRYKQFPYYDVLYEIYEGIFLPMIKNTNYSYHVMYYLHHFYSGQMAEGKHCKRTTDGTDGRYNNMSHLLYY